VRSDTFFSSNNSRSSNRYKLTHKNIGDKKVISTDIAHGNKNLHAGRKIESKHCQDRTVENVIILQGGGSLGAFGCGVLKGLLNNGIHFDIVCGTSIGAINGAVCVGNNAKDIDPVERLENFWMEIAESSIKILPDVFYLDFDTENMQHRDSLGMFGLYSSMFPSIKKINSAPLNAGIFGVPKMFYPRWNPLWWIEKRSAGDNNNKKNKKVTNHFNIEDDNKNNGNNKSNNNKIKDQPSQSGTNFDPSNWTYIYDHTPLRFMLEKYIDYENLTPVRKEWKNNSQIDHNKGNHKYINSNCKDKKISRLIVTAVNVMTSEPLVFDSFKMDIKSEHLLACCGYPLYGFPWIEIDKGVFGWDGSLLNNTPLREVIQASPKNDKNVFIVENYPRKIGNLPTNMAEVLDRARDIIFSDKTKHTIRLSKIITRQIQLIEELYEVFESTDKSKIDSEKSQRIKKEYDKLIHNHGAEILSINRISRNRIESPNVLKNADFSPRTVRGLIGEGERKAIECLNNADITL
jgi:NTE family protein